jgi:hypothetical protein
VVPGSPVRPWRRPSFRDRFSVVPDRVGFPVDMGFIGQPESPSATFFCGRAAGSYRNEYLQIPLTDRDHWLDSASLDLTWIRLRSLAECRSVGCLWLFENPVQDVTIVIVKDRIVHGCATVLAPRERASVDRSSPAVAICR